ncbi:hypothetical protein RCL1_004996 [Eukaryota sp. TZLM3-RCL]
MTSWKDYIDYLKGFAGEHYLGCAMWTMDGTPVETSDEELQLVNPADFIKIRNAFKSFSKGETIDFKVGRATLLESGPTGPTFYAKLSITNLSFVRSNSFIICVHHEDHFRETIHDAIMDLFCFLCGNGY